MRIRPFEAQIFAIIGLLIAVCFGSLYYLDEWRFTGFLVPVFAGATVFFVNLFIYIVGSFNQDYRSTARLPLVQYLSPDQCSTIHLWRLNSVNWSGLVLAMKGKRTAVLVVGAGQGDTQRTLRSAKWYKVWRPAFATRVCRTGGGGVLWVLRKRAWAE
jgi:hypothetical protein